MNKSRSVLCENRTVRKLVERTERGMLGSNGWLGEEGWLDREQRNTHTGRHPCPDSDNYFLASLAPPPWWHCFSSFAAVPPGKSFPCLPPLFLPFPFLDLRGLLFPFSSPSFFPLPLLLLLPFPLLHLFFPLLPLQSASLAVLAWSEESPARSCCARAGKHASLCTARFLSCTLPVSLESPLYFVLSLLLCWNWKKGVKKKKRRRLPNGGTNKERQKEEAKLYSQWHKREAERVLETKSGNSTGALQTEWWDREVGGNACTPTHSLSITYIHTHTQCSKYRPMTSSI